MKGGTLFSGIGAPEAAMPSVDWRWHAEIEPFPAAVMSHHFPHSKNLGDVSKINWKDVETVDLLVAGPPCQAFSVAGLRDSLEDARGNMSLIFARAVHVIDPKYVVYENVPGILSTKDNAFGCVLAGLVGSSDALTSGLEAGRWTDAGMVIGPVRSAAWRVLDAQGAVPQRRRRVFIVSCRVSDGINPGAILFEPEADLIECLGNWDRFGSLFPVASGVSGHIAPSRETRTAIAASLTRGADISGKVAGSDHCHEQTCEQYHAAMDAEFGPAKPMAFQSKASSTQSMNPSEIAPSLDVCKSGGTAVAYQCHGTNVGEMGTLRKGNGNETGGVPFVTQAIPLLEIGKGTTSRGEGPNGCGIGQPEEVCPTLQGAGAGATSDMRPCVAFHERGRAGGPNVESQEDVAYSLTAPNGGGRRQEMNVATPTMAVRRLLPVECEKLQGFPPGFTDVPFRGKPAADGNRYRALGNSMCVNVMRWVGERIDMADTTGVFPTGKAGPLWDAITEE